MKQVEVEEKTETKVKVEKAQTFFTSTSVLVCISYASSHSEIERGAQAVANGGPGCLLESNLCRFGFKMDDPAFGLGTPGGSEEPTQAYYKYVEEGDAATTKVYA